MRFSAMSAILCFTLACVGCDLPDTATLAGCKVSLVGINLHEISPSPWVTARISGAQCKSLDWSRLEWFMGPADALNITQPAGLMPLPPHNDKACKLWQWPETFAQSGGWYLLGTFDGVAVMDLSHEDIPLSGLPNSVLPAYRWQGQPWTIVLFGGPECPGTDGPQFPDPSPPQG